MKTLILVPTLALCLLHCTPSPHPTEALHTITADEFTAVDEYRNSLNHSSPRDPIIDPKDPSIKARLTFPSELRRPQPPYPPELRKERIQGRSLLAGVIEKDGSVSNVAVLSSTGSPDLDKVCVETLRLWRYKPAQVDGVPVRLVVTTTFTFKLP